MISEASGGFADETLPIFYKEMRAVIECVRNVPVQVELWLAVDNKSVVGAIKRTRSPTEMGTGMLIELFSTLVERCILLHVVWIPTIFNGADPLSRGQTNDVMRNLASVEALKVEMARNS